MSANALEIVHARPSDQPSWEAFTGMSAGAEAGHRWEFHDLLATVFGQKAIRLVARRGGNWVGVLPLVLQRSLVGRFLTSVPYLNYAGVLGEDPEARRTLAEKASGLFDSLRVDRLELRGRDGADLSIPAWAGKACYQLELPEDLDALRKGLKSKVRSQVRRPLKEGYVARVVEGDGRRSFYPLLARRWHELGSPVLPESFFKELEGVFGRDLEYVVVEKGLEAVAAGVLLSVGQHVEIPWAASAAEHDRYGVNMLLYWTSLERAIARGAAWFDFGRSTPGSGNARFKLQWGATEQPLQWNVRVRDARGRAGERGDSRRDFVARAWRRIPRFLANRLGPVLAARIPY